MGKIILIGLLYETNLGDPLSFYCTEYLIRKFDPNIEIEYLDFYGRTALLSEKGNYDNLIQKIEKKGYSAAKSILGTRIQYFTYKKRETYCEEYYDEHFKNASLIIIVAAGTITYKVRLDCGPYYALVAKYAQKYSIPVVVNSAGVENPYNRRDYRCRRLSEALSSEYYKIVTTRDNFEELKRYIRNPKTIVDKVADIGVWASETFNIMKDEQSETVGLGIITYKRFKEFKKGITHSQYNNIFVDIIVQLEERKKPWKLFTNGNGEDYDNAVEICRTIGVDPKDCILVPSTPKELVEIISGFKGIISSRLHSCIVAYSLEIPFIAISWNNKVDYFAEAICYPERIVTANNLLADNVLTLFNDAIEHKYDITYKNDYRMKNIEYIKKYIELRKKTITEK